MLLGSAIAREDAAEVFDRLGIVATPVDEDTLEVEVPGYRVDVEREVDLIEEIARVRGYDLVGSTLPPVRQAGGFPPGYIFQGRVRRAMAAAGVVEVRTIPFASDEDLAVTGADGAIRVTNPLQADEAWLRTGLLPALLKTARRNAHRQVRSVAIFEANTVFRLEGDAPREHRSVAFVMAGLAATGWSEPVRPFDVFDAKGVVESLLAELGIEAETGPPPGGPFHPGRSAEVRVAGDAIGAVGELHPKVAAAYDLAGRVAAGVLDVDALMRRAAGDVAIEAVPRFPPVRRDLAFTVPGATPAGAVRAALEDAAGDLLDECVLFDVHAGPPLPAGTKSLAFSVDFRAADRTLTDAETDGAVAAIVDRLRRDFGAELRSG
jgi:phenylalanyl-tRNA synthetase beta chain